MNRSEDLALKMQKVKLAIAEVNDQRFETLKKRRIKLETLSRIENDILRKSKELRIDLETA